MMDFRSGSPSDNSGAEEMEVSLAKPKHRVVRPLPSAGRCPGTPFLLCTVQSDHQKPGSEGGDAAVPEGLGAHSHHPPEPQCSELGCRAPILPRARGRPSGPGRHPVP